MSEFITEYDSQGRLVLKEYIGTGRVISVPEGIEVIGKRAFIGVKCSKIKLPSSVRVIEDKAFAFSQMKEISLSENIRYMGESVFEKCIQLTHLELPEGLEEIRDNSFSGCSLLESISFPQSLKKIGHFVFFDCSSLRELIIPDSVESVSVGCFFGCNGLRRLICRRIEFIQKNVVDKFGGFSATNCSVILVLLSDIKSISRENREYILSVLSFYEDALIESFKRRYLPEAFRAYLELRGVKIKKAQRYFEDRDFIHLQGAVYDYLESKGVQMSLSMKTKTEIIDDCFVVGHNKKGECVLLKYLWDEDGNTVRIPDGIEIIGQSSMSRVRCSRIILPDSVKELEGKCFYNCFADEINIPDSVKKIGERAFAGSGLRQVIIPASVTEIGEGAFRNCESLDSIILRAAINKISGYAFYGCRSLRNIRLPEGIESIGDFAFSLCDYMEEITLPEGIRSIGSFAFRGCSRLREIVLPTSLKRMKDYTFLNCSGLIRLEIPDRVECFSASNIVGCTNLEHFTCRNIAFFSETMENRGSSLIEKALVPKQQKRKANETALLYSLINYEKLNKRAGDYIKMIISSYADELLPRLIQANNPKAFGLFMSMCKPSQEKLQELLEGLEDVQYRCIIIDLMQKENKGESYEL